MICVGHLSSPLSQQHIALSMPPHPYTPQAPAKEKTFDADGFPSPNIAEIQDVVHLPLQSWTWYLSHSYPVGYLHRSDTV
jgi:hypothetical protein